VEIHLSFLYEGENPDLRLCKATGEKGERDRRKRREKGSRRDCCWTLCAPVVKQPVFLLLKNRWRKGNF